MNIKPIQPGTRFGLLTFVAQEKRDNGYFLRCICDCGKEALARRGSVTRGLTKSCGCYRGVSSSERSRTHGHTVGYRKSRMYKVWLGMVKRCHAESSKHFPNWGGRGIRVCDRWRNSFETFLADMGECPVGLSIERMNNDGNYEPGNCRWASPAEQQMNRRNTVRVAFDGVCLTLKQWADRTGIPYRTLLDRRRAGWEPSRLLQEPVARVWSDDRTSWAAR